jgi:hypothetical protein
MRLRYIRLRSIKRITVLQYLEDIFLPKFCLLKLFFVDLDYEVRSVAVVPGVLSHRGRFLPLIQVFMFYSVVADRNRFDADPDPTFRFDVYPIQIFTYVRKFL